MIDLLIAIGWWFIGFMSFPVVMFLRARRSDHWDSSNFGNMLRVLIHLALHPEDFGQLVHKGTGKRVFWYISEDELKGVTKTR